MISVIIPYYNPDSDPVLDRLLERAVASAVHELDGFTPFEIIVVNDGSPRPPLMARGCQDRRIHFPGRVHGRLGAARNTGLAHAAGDIVTFLDCDDFYLPGTLRTCIEAMAESQADLLGFGFLVTHRQEGTGKTPRQTPKFSKPTDGNSFMRSHNLFGSSCMYLIQRSLIDREGLRFMENSFIEDEEFTPRLVFSARRFVHTDYKVYGYYRRSGSIITSHTPQAIEERRQNALAAIMRLQQFRDSRSDEPHDGLDRKISTLATDCLRRALRTGGWRAAVAMMKSDLARIGLYPVPDEALPLKFRLYSKLSQSHAGLGILRIFEKGKEQ